MSRIRRLRRYFDRLRSGLSDCKAQKHPDRGRERYGEQQPNKSEQGTECEQCEHQPDWVELDPPSNDARRQHIVSEHFPHKTSSANDNDWRPARPKLGNRHAHRDHKTCTSAEIGDEANQTGYEADRNSMMETDAPQDGGVEHTQNETYDCLPAHEACNGVIDLPPQRSNLIAVLGGDPSVDGGDHLVPIDGDVDCNYRRYDQKRHEREQRVSPRPERAQNVIEPIAASAADDRCRGLVEG